MLSEIKITFSKSITADEVNKLPQRSFEGDIIVVDSEKILQNSIIKLKQSGIIGFDTETKPSFKKGIGNRNSVALLQLSTGDEAFLFRITKIGLPQPVADILSDKNITKVGVAIREDIRILQKIQPFRPDGFIELQDYVKQFHIENFSLKKMAAIILNFRISKSQRLSDWESESLSAAQNIYAATDAWVCREIYLKLTDILRQQATSFA